MAEWGRGLEKMERNRALGFYPRFGPIRPVLLAPPQSPGPVESACALFGEPLRQRFSRLRLTFSLRLGPVIGSPANIGWTALFLNPTA
jgi:hypothetical protein